MLVFFHQIKQNLILWGGNMSKELGMILRAYRANCGLTQLQVAEAMHLDRSTYAYYERGTTEPDLKGLKKLSAVFNVDPTLLLPDEEGRFSLRVSDVVADEDDTAQTDEVQQEGEQEESVKELEPVVPVDEKIFELSKEEKSLVAFYRVMGITDKDRVMTYVRGVLDESNK